MARDLTRDDTAEAPSDEWHLTAGLAVHPLDLGDDLAHEVADVAVVATEAPSTRVVVQATEVGADRHRAGVAPAEAGKDEHGAPVPARLRCQLVAVHREARGLEHHPALAHHQSLRRGSPV